MHRTRLYAAILTALLLLPARTDETILSDRAQTLSTAHSPMHIRRYADGAPMHSERELGQSDNWSGYTVTNSETQATYSSAQGSWTVPSVTYAPVSGAGSWEYSSSWIGIGGSCVGTSCTDSSLLQLGTEQDASASGSTQYYAWYELLPAGPVNLPYAVKPGDAMTASISCTASCSSATQLWTISIADITQNWNWNRTISYASSMLSAEWIEEAVSICSGKTCTPSKLPNFGQVTFNADSANGVKPGLSYTVNGIKLTDASLDTALPSQPTQSGGFTVCWGGYQPGPCSFSTGPTPLSAAVLPSSRATMVGRPVTAFATIINSGTATASGCGVYTYTSVPGTFTFQATNPLTNAPVGQANQTVDIPAGASQSFVLSFNPLLSLSATDVWLDFACANANGASIASGIDTLLLSANYTLPPDIVALAATVTNDGILSITGNQGAAAFAVATVNLGSTATMTATPTTGTAFLPLSLSICQTSPSTGACLATPQSSVTVSLGANATPTFAIFATASGAVPFLPQKNRIYLKFQDSTGSTYGSTSVAVRTQ